MIKVSIIVPVYNTEKYLRGCLESLVNQTLDNYEIIIVNDGTKDDSQRIIDEYKKKYPKLIKPFIKENGGLGDARNVGIDKSSGKYIGFVDSDDYVDKTMFEKLYNKAEITNSDIVESDFFWEYGNKSILDNASYYDTKESIMLNVRVLVCNKIFRKSLIDEHKISFPIGLRYEDILFTYKVLAYVNKVTHVEEGLYYYVQRDSSITNVQNERVRDIFLIFSQLVDYYKENKIYYENESILEYLHIRYLLGSSYLRITKISNKALKKEILNENWKYLNNTFPNWKLNKYLKIQPGLKNKYYRYTNRLFYNIGSFIFKFKK